MPDAVIEAIGTLLAAASRWLRDNRHWLSVVLLLIITSKTLALLSAALIRAVRERALAFGCAVATTFAVLLRHLSHPPQVWAAQ